MVHFTSYPNPFVVTILSLIQSLKECTQDMDSDTWNAYHILSNRARSVCYGARQQQFRALTQMTVNKLMASSNQQLEFIQELKVGFSQANYLEYMEVYTDFITHRQNKKNWETWLLKL